MLNNFWIITFLHTQKGNRYSQSELTLLWILKKQKKKQQRTKSKIPTTKWGPLPLPHHFAKNPKPTPPNSKETRAVKHFWVQPHSQWLVTSLLRNIYRLTTALSLQLERRPWSDHTLQQRMESWMPSASRWVQGAEPWSLLYLYATFFNMVDVFSWNLTLLPHEGEQWNHLHFSFWGIFFCVNSGQKPWSEFWVSYPKAKITSRELLVEGYPTTR